MFSDTIPPPSKISDIDGSEPASADRGMTILQITVTVESTITVGSLEHEYCQSSSGKSIETVGLQVIVP